MATIRVQYKQSLPDIVLQNFGNLNYLVQVANDNNMSVTENLTAGDELVINSEGIGDKGVKNSIIEQSLTFNNDYILILAGNFIFETGDNWITEDGDNLILE